MSRAVLSGLGERCQGAGSPLILHRGVFPTVPWATCFYTAGELRPVFSFLNVQSVAAFKLLFQTELRGYDRE